ncbi:sulfatase [Seonamhaeicola marinus]|uniref:Sulfatase n=1 Tax=Seonamhaeicola marinus TaxID=1912246 RepID=A0A5D0HYT3_9FLAO|nr:sulfatase [Seonamhaeicola marinus]TYA74652.1 sulfatase [Seonamhaeicola marinus]
MHLKRRLVVLGIVSIVFLTTYGQKVNQPNILFISIDDLRTELGAYGNSQLITPNLDALASQGRLFNNHFVQVPTCGPSRACMLTGQNLKKVSDISHSHLAKQLTGKPESEYPETFVHHLKRNGYYTVGMGKISHNASGYYKGKLELPNSWDEFVYDPNNPWKQGLLHAYANGRTRGKGERQPYEFLNVKDEQYPDGMLANDAVKTLERLAKNDKPFFMAVGFFKPHLPFCAPKKYWDLYNHDDIKLSPNPDLPENVSNVFLHDSGEFFGQYEHPEKGGAGKRLSNAYAKNVRHAYYASVSYTDVQVGKVLNKLKDLGLDKNTIIIVWGDHGWHLGDHTIWGKHSSFERALKSTFLIKTPNIKKPGVSTDALVASVDIYPTICDLAGVKKPIGLDGQSMIPILENPKAKGKDIVHSYWRNIISMRDSRYRMAIFKKDGKEELMLFDHAKDPNETKNIAEEHPRQVQKFKKALNQIDKGFLTN